MATSFEAEWAAKSYLGTVSGIGPAAEVSDAGWSSPVARQAHNLKVLGSNPSPAPTKERPCEQSRGRLLLVVVRAGGDSAEAEILDEP